MRTEMKGIIAATMMTMGQGDAGAGPPLDEVQAAVRTFARAGDQRDVAGLEAILDGNFRVVFGLKPGEARSVMTRAQYLDLIKAGELGGGERTVEVATPRRAGGFATAETRLRRADATFEGVMTLVRNGERWQILEDAVTMTPRAK